MPCAVFKTRVGRLITSSRDWAWEPKNVSALMPDLIVNLSKQPPPDGSYYSKDSMSFAHAYCCTAFAIKAVLFEFAIMGGRVMATA